MASVVSRQQFLAAVQSVGNPELLFQAVSGDVNSETWIQYNSATCVSSADTLAGLFQSVYGLTDMDMIDFFNMAVKLPGGSCCCNN